MSLGEIMTNNRMRGLAEPSIARDNNDASTTLDNNVLHCCLQTHLMATELMLSLHVS